MRKVQQGDHVIIEYEGRLEDGEIVESSSDNGPLEFEVGAGRCDAGELSEALDDAHRTGLNGEKRRGRQHDGQYHEKDEEHAAGNF